jgi:formylglycine-generating enzyme required for sulfatase activity
VKAQLQTTPKNSGMVWIPGGAFLMGSDKAYVEEAPVRRVEVDGFWIDRHSVTNQDFGRFVEETGYVTFYEVPPDSAQYPGAKNEMLQPASVVFRKPSGKVALGNPYQWWRFMAGANWRRPQGPGSTLEGKEEHPVVHVAYCDVEAYARWVGKALLTEAEWEFAARGGLDGAEFAWGDEFAPGGQYRANTWQGEFPWQNLQDDGYEGTSPVNVFPANGYGLLDMIGNVWEWTKDWYASGHKKLDCCGLRNPRGAEEGESFDPRMAHLRIPRKVMKGGSHLCAPNYCRRYRPAARMAQPIDTSTSHLGFRCVRRMKHG